MSTVHKNGKRLSRFWSYALVTIAASLWGFGFVFGKLALSDMPVGAMITYRFAIASLVVAPLLAFRQLNMTRRDFWMFLLAGTFYVPVQFLLQFQGLSLTTLSHAALVVALLPAFIALASIVTARNAPRPNWLAITASAIGATLIVLRPGGNATVAGDLLVVLSLGGAVIWVLMSERINRRHDPMASSALILVLGTGVLIAFEALVHPHDLIGHYSRTAWFATIASGVLATAITTVIWNVGLKGVPAADAGVFINLEPLIGATCGIFIFSDVLGWWTIAGGALIIAGAILVTRNAGPKQTVRDGRLETAEALLELRSK
ncbi:MAG: DMT family transporter [Candidatus Eremiobacteraeota bacterium]|nr:DMT family transporter [Candidatus Eremiobacteraeota bacterium]